MKLLLILWTLFKESQFANYGMPSNSLSSLHHKKTIPRAGIVFVCLDLFTIQAIVLVDRVHGDVDTELAKDILVFVCQHHG